MSVSRLSASAQNYLKVIWGLQEWSDDPVTSGAIAAKAGVTAPTVSAAMTKLADQGLVDHQRYGRIALTPSGRALALDMVRRHRLIETFLVETLGYRWDQVHDEAEVLEHAVSDLLIDRLAAFLGHPGRDPHGDPIPTAEGGLEMPDAVNLADVTPPERVVVQRIADDDPDLLRYFADCGIEIGARLEVTQGPPYSDGLQVSVGDPTAEPLVLGRQALGAVWVSVVD